MVTISLIILLNCLQVAVIVKAKVVGTCLCALSTNICQTTGSTCDTWLAAWFYEHAATITSRKCGRKKQLSDGTIAHYTVDYSKHEKHGHH